MEVTLTATTTTLPLFSAGICRTRLPLLRSRPIATTANNSPLFQRMNTGAVRRRLDCVTSSAASFASSGDGGESDVIVLDVRGMMCGGCESSVKRILENQSQVSSASADHKTERAIVWPTPEAKATPNWQKVIGEELAKNLTNCGFDSNLRG